MSEDTVPLFALEEADHLTRIHLKLGLEDIGFDVLETQDTIALVGPASALETPPAPTLADVIADRLDPA